MAFNSQGFTYTFGSISIHSWIKYKTMVMHSIENCLYGFRLCLICKKNWKNIFFVLLFFYWLPKKEHSEMYLICSEPHTNYHQVHTFNLISTYKYWCQTWNNNRTRKFKNDLEQTWGLGDSRKKNLRWKYRKILLNPVKYIVSMKIS